MSWICVGCQQVQATKYAFMPVMNHTHSVIEVKKSILSGLPGKVVFVGSGVPAESQLRKDVRTAMERDGANADLISATVKGLP